MRQDGQEEEEDDDDEAIDSEGGVTKMSNFKQQLQKMKTHPGFIAALDQSGGSTPKALGLYGIKEDAWSNEEEMFAIVHQMRTRIITSPSFTGERILAAILFENTMDRDIEGQPTADYLWNVKRVVPFLKVDKGLAAEKDGVQLMKPMPELAALLDKAKAKRIFGTKMRSVIKQANAAGIKDIVNQQFEVARQIIAAGLVPIIEPEVDIHCPEKAKAEELLKAAILEKLNELPGGSAGHAQAHPAGARRLLRRLRQSSQCREGGCAVGRLYAGRSQRPPAQESRHRGELFAGAGRGAIGPAIRCRVQRPAGCIHSEYL